MFLSSKILRQYDLLIYYIFICYISILSKVLYNIKYVSEIFPYLHIIGISYGIEFVLLYKFVTIYPQNRLKKTIFKFINVTISLVLSLQLQILLLTGTYTSFIMLDNIDLVSDAETIYDLTFIVYELIILILASFILRFINNYNSNKISSIIHSFWLFKIPIMLSIIFITTIQINTLVYDNIPSSSLLLGPLTSSVNLLAKPIIVKYYNKAIYGQYYNISNPGKYPLEHIINDSKHSSNYTPKLKNPNIVILFIEGTSADLLDIYSSNLQITPCINRFSEKSLVVDNYFNHTAATVRGLTGQLTSSYSRLKPAARTQNDRFVDLNLENGFWIARQLFENGNISNKDSVAKIISLGTNKQYSTQIIHPEGQDSVLHGILNTLNFDLVDGKENIEKSITESTSNRWQKDFVKDQYVLQYTLDAINKKNRENKPWLIVAYTVGTHSYAPPSNSDIVFKTEKYVTQRIESIDYDLCGFINGLDNTHFFDENILVITTDHALFPEPDYVNMHESSDYVPSFVSRVPLIIRAPNIYPGRLDVSGRNSVDLLPTVLDLVEMGDIPVHFAGRSLFLRDSAEQTYYISAIGDDFYLTHGDRVVSMLSAGERAQKDRLIGWVHWLYSLEDQNRLSSNISK